MAPNIFNNNITHYYPEGSTKRAITGMGEFDWLRKHVLQIENAR